MSGRTRTGILSAVLCCAVVACGDSDRTNVRIPGDAITPGFFVGETAQGGDMSIAVDSIRSVFLVCGADDVFRLFDPPAPFGLDGRFSVRLGPADQIAVRGRIVNDDRLEGTISGDPDCEGDFVVRRCDPADEGCGDADGDTIPDRVDPDAGPRPTQTPRPATPTPTGIKPTPTATATPGENLCGNGAVDEDEECDGSDLDDYTCYDLCDQEDEGGTLRCNSDCTFDFSRCPDPDTCEGF